MLLEELGGAVASIAEVRREVVVEQVALLLLRLVNSHLQMVYSRLGMFLVVCSLCYSRQGQLAHAEGVLVVRLASAVECRLRWRFLHREGIPPWGRFDGLHCTGDEHSTQPRTVECRLLGVLSFSS